MQYRYNIKLKTKDFMIDLCGYYLCLMLKYTSKKIEREKKKKNLYFS